METKGNFDMKPEDYKNKETKDLLTPTEFQMVDSHLQLVRMQQDMMKHPRKWSQNQDKDFEL